jgi:hypothetical protein
MKHSPSASSEQLITASVIAILTVASLVLMLWCASPEFSWDEAVYVANTNSPWSYLWRTFSYTRHSHGPMAIYLAKLGQELPTSVGSLESRSRFFVALVGSLATGMLYWMLRRFFRTSRLAALVGSSLLLFSVIRLEETNVIGPHHLMLACTLAVVALGYHWRDAPTLRAAVGLGAVFAFGAVSMTYVIPAALCWAIGVALAGVGWITLDRTHLKVSWSIPLMLLIAAIIAVALWPPSVLHRMIINDFRVYLKYPAHPTLVGDRIFERTPRWAVIYWLAHLDAPILVFPVSVIVLASWNAFRNGRFSPKHVYLAVCLMFFLATALAAHMAGARNTLQFVALLCLATGAQFDEALEHRRHLVPFAATAVIALAAVNLIWHSQSHGYTPSLATTGYRAFLQQDENDFRQKAKALVYGLPVLAFYAQQNGGSMTWDACEVPWTTRADAPLLPEVKYVLMPAFVYNYMPAEQPMRRIVAEHWNIAWSFKAGHAWELRLYEKP